MRDFIAPADQLAALLVLDKLQDNKLLSTHAYYRGNPDLRIIIPYANYKAFLRELPLDEQILCFTRRQIEEQHAHLKAYFYDMAFAVCKELYYNPQRPTTIVHTFQSNLPKIPLYLCPHVENKLRMAMASRGTDPTSKNPAIRYGYEIRSNSDLSMRHWQYATQLFTIVDYGEWESELLTIQ